MPRLVLADCPKCGGEREPKWVEFNLWKYSPLPAGLNAVCSRCGFTEPTAPLDSLPSSSEWPSWIERVVIGG